MRIVNLRTNHMTNPIGFSMDAITLQWQVAESEGHRAETSRIWVARDGGFKEIIYDSGETNLDSLGTIVPVSLEPSTRYFWQVWVRTDRGEAATSEPAWFETAKNEKMWEASWIQAAFAEDGVLWQDFAVEKEVAWARLSISGLGLYEVYVDGRKVGEEYLTPGMNDFDSWIQFQTYPLEMYLDKGNHKIEIMLGSGWYKGRYLTYTSGTPKQKYGSAAAAIAEIHIRYADGTKDLIKTDETWHSKKSKVRWNSMFDGECYDAGFESDEYESVQFSAVGTGRLKARLSLPVKKKLVLKPEKLITTPKNELVLDFGQNMAGWMVFYNRLPKGSKCKFTYGEILQDDCFYHGNMRTAKTEFVFISDGQEQWVRPHFTYYGFRYVKLEGIETTVSLTDFEAWVLYSDMEDTGEIVTSDEKINRLISNVVWSQRSNFIDVPTDCPQRDERLGWTGDTQVFARTAAYNMNVAAFFKKHMFDVWCEQKKNDGMVPMVVPDLFLTATSAAWGDIAAIVPWTLYLMYGDQRLLAEQYPGMKAWVDYIYALDEGSGGSRLWNVSGHFGDWLSMDGPGNTATGGTDMHLIATAFYCYSARLVKMAAAVLGADEDERRYGALEREITKAFQHEYVTPGGRLAVDTQTAYVVVLYMKLCPEAMEASLLKRLIAKLLENGGSLSTGFVGTPYLCPVLSMYGESRMAYDLLFREAFPGWLYCVNMGATTIWERWDSVTPDGKMNADGMNSLNHYAYGSIQQWMYEYMAGIRPKAEFPGWKKFYIAPHPDRRLKWVHGSYRSPYGKISSDWEYQDNGRLRFHFQIPFGTEAEVVLPCDKADGFMLNGERLSQKDELMIKRCEDGLSIKLRSGSYEFCDIPVSGKLPAWNEDSLLADLLADPDCSAIIGECLPELAGRKAEYYNCTLRECIHSVFNPYTMIDLTGVVQRFNEQWNYHLK